MRRIKTYAPVTSSLIGEALAGAIKAPKPLTLAEAFKPKRAGTKTSHVVMILDESSSMNGSTDATISSCNEFLDSQRKDSKAQKIKTFVSIVKFDGNNVISIVTRKNIKEVEHITRRDYNPAGMTNLNDAIGSVMLTVNNLFAETKKADRDSIIINILTDGYENASSTFGSIDIKQMIGKAEAKDWVFTFMGADIDAFAASSVYGFQEHNTIQFSKGAMAGTMSIASNKVSAMRQARSEGTSTQSLYASSAFTDDERATAVGDDNDKDPV